MAHFVTRLRERGRLLIEFEDGTSALVRVEQFGEGSVQLSVLAPRSVRLTPESILAYGQAEARPDARPPTDRRQNHDWRMGGPGVAAEGGQP